VPPRASFLSGLALAVVAAHGFHTLIDKKPRADISKGSLAVVGLATLTITLAVGIFILTGEFNRNTVWAICFTILGAICVGLLIKLPDRLQIWSFFILGLAVIDLGYTNLSLYRMRSDGQMMSESSASILPYIFDEEERVRVYSPSYSVPQQIAVVNGIEMADGVDPMQLEVYAAFMEDATGVDRQGYQLSIPPYKSGDPSQDNVGSTPNARLLGLLNVKYVASSFPIDSPDLDLQARVGDEYLYVNREYLPRAWIQPDQDGSSDDFRAVEITAYEANRIELNAEGPGTLVISEIIYPGWTARVDGESVEISPVHSVLRGIELPAGNHDVSLSLKPTSLYIGLILAIVGWMIVLLSPRRKELRRDVE
jgi:hypothetical protein